MKTVRWFEKLDLNNCRFYPIDKDSNVYVLDVPYEKEERWNIFRELCLMGVYQKYSTLHRKNLVYPTKEQLEILISAFGEIF